jgi:MtrB/PioB family decaheme-associated outer membrane protein
MKKTLLSSLIAGLFIAGPALAQAPAAGPMAVQGSVSLGAIHTEESNTVDRAKLYEYRDLSNGLISNAELLGRSDRFWFDAFGENFGREDEYAAVRGGAYEAFKFRVYTDKFRHNFLYGGRTPYTGSGTDALRATFPYPHTGNWNDVDIGYKRRDTGGMFEWQGFSPWYFRVDANRIKTEGTKIGAAANGTSPGNGFVDLALPVDWVTNNVTAEGGYNTRTFHFAAAYTHSTFDNAFETVTWNNPFWANGIDATYLAPDNDYDRVAVNATWRGLPMRSTIAVRGTMDRLESSATLARFALNGTGAAAFGLTNPSESTFDGKVKNRTFTLALSSEPMTNVDTRAWLNYYKRDNDSTLVEFAAVSGLNCGGAPCDNELYHYKKWNAGLDAYYRLNRANRIGAGIDWWDIERERLDYDETRDTRLFAEWKNSALENVTARLKYTHLIRRSDFLRANAGLNSSDPEFLNRFVARYDASDLDQDALKLAVDVTPVPLVDLSFEGIYKNSKYKDTVLGRTKDRRYELYGSVGLGDPNRFRVLVFGDIEHIKYDSFHRNISNLTAPGAYDPETPPIAQNYNWSAVNKDKNWVAGVAADWPVMERLLLRGSFLYYKTDGNADIQSQNNFGNPLPINEYDDTKKTSFNVKGTYTVNRNWAVTAGYAYERYEYRDIQYNDYQYIIPAANNATSYLNGYNAFIPYKANIVYLLGTYRF